MNRLGIISCILLSPFFLEAQDCHHMIKKSWYANVYNVDKIYQDTLVLFDVIDSIDATKGIMRWEYRYKTLFRPVYNLKQQGLLSDPIYMRSTKWKRANGKLIIKHRNQNIKYHVTYYCKNGSLYKLILFRDS